jgi:hypothetical protein
MTIRFLFCVLSIATVVSAVDTRIFKAFPTEIRTFEGPGTP